MTTRIAVIDRATRKAAWRAFLEHLEAGRLDGFDRVILQHDERKIAHVSFEAEDRRSDAA